MKIVCISDTHNKLSQVDIPSGDILIHCGDATMMGNEKEIRRFSKDLSALSHKYKIFVPGNHDFMFEYDPGRARSLIYADNPDLIILEDKGITLEGISFWGCPVNTNISGWAFYKNSKQNQDIVDMMPSCDVLITHEPPKNILDKCKNGDCIGNLLLREKVLDTLKPKFHVFGHIHESYGSTKIDNTAFINCSVMNEKYQVVNKPICFNM
jgi:Icc-related predicted phosphoesterase